MILLWTWGGEFFGYRENDELWTYDGRQVGWFVNEEVYGLNGKYLGEIKSNDRLITHITKKHLMSGVYAPYANKAGIVKYANYVGRVMYAGYEDFPLPQNI